MGLAKPFRATLLQISIAVAGLLLIAFAPSAQGRMMLIPLGADSAHGLAAAALSRGALLVARGPLPGSLIVDGKRAALAGPLLRRGILLAAAPAAGCGVRFARTRGAA